ncbi:MAG: hypothetical protein ACXWW8_06555 [Solirubrobacterales bacterium]
MGFFDSLAKRFIPGFASADAYGAIAVPGETSLDLQAGKVKLTYQESKRSASHDEDIDFGVPGSLSVEVTPAAGGGALEVKGVGFKGMGSNVSTMKDLSRAQIGSIEIASPGSYKATAKGAPADAVEPQILIGK